MNFLPTDYKIPKANTFYVKLQEGETRIRILSRPIIGWEDWKDNRPIRYRMDQKPLTSIDPDKPMRHFWSCIVWNYNEKQIQIYHITQASIKKSIESLCRDKDWGAPFFYDIKIIKKGNMKDTEYMVNPLPPKPVSEEIIKAFHDRPVCLEALFSGEDPFSRFNESFTPGVFKRDGEIELQVVNPPESNLIGVNITEIQSVELENLLNDCDDNYRMWLYRCVEKQFNTVNFYDLPSEEYPKLKNAILSHIEEVGSSKELMAVGVQ